MGKGRYGPLGFAATKRIRQREARGLRGKRRKRGSSLFSLSAPEMAQLLVESLQASVDRGRQQTIMIFRKQLRLRAAVGVGLASRSAKGTVATATANDNDRPEAVAAETVTIAEQDARTTPTEART